MSPEWIGILGLIVMVVLLLLRVPVGVAMIAVGIVGFALITNPRAALSRLGSDAFFGASLYSLSVIPLFVLMGLLLASAQLGADVYKAIDVFLWKLRGGLGVATIGAAAMFGAVSGSAVASATTMSVVAVPEMRRFDYDPGYAAATAAVGGTLGALIPPSAVLVLYGVLTEEPIGQVLIGGIIPGILCTLILMGIAHLVVLARPHYAPRPAEKPDLTRWGAVRLVWAVPVIFGISMGGIYLGIFTPTEAGGAGAFLSLLYGVITRRMTWQAFMGALTRTIRTTSFIFMLVIAGQIFGFFLTNSRIPIELGEWITSLEIAPWLIVTVVFVVYFILGALMDEIAILVIMTPIMYPVIIALGYSGVWFGVLTIMMLLTGLLMPPVGLITFVVAGVTRIPLGDVFRGIFPFVGGLAVAIMLVIFFPGLVTWLPDLMVR
ncbi:MAG: TRAP transporter large permease [Acidimicrobiia bacterium]|nr:TRAP transporter large permease [Acidimicrobiia bacterium]NND14072.1 TRAP transporter large permease [Acidimicrobiia bacterium]NNL28334.1 TRAP transporter large permease [Acidimicrobiia bacterium]NNL47121.1 TRAP transporter large permease [Acidimicrobiia bacterium]